MYAKAAKRASRDPTTWPATLRADFQVLAEHAEMKTLKTTAKGDWHQAAQNVCAVGVGEHGVDIMLTLANGTTQARASRHRQVRSRRLAMPFSLAREKLTPQTGRFVGQNKPSWSGLAAMVENS